MVAAKLIRDNEISHAHNHYENKFINLRHWRALREYKHEGVDGLFVILKNFRMYFIPGYTMEMLHEANYCNKTLDVPYVYIKNVLSCDKCDGNGKTDWVKAARGINPERNWIRTNDHTNFTRSKNNPINISQTDSRYPPYYTSTVVTHKGDKICQRCSGSGLLFAQDWTVKGSIKVEHS